MLAKRASGRKIGANTREAYALEPPSVVKYIGGGRIAINCPVFSKTAARPLRAAARAAAAGRALLGPHGGWDGRSRRQRPAVPMGRARRAFGCTLCGPERRAARVARGACERAQKPPVLGGARRRRRARPRPRARRQPAEKRTARFSCAQVARLPAPIQNAGCARRRSAAHGAARAGAFSVLGCARAGGFRGARGRQPARTRGFRARSTGLVCRWVGPCLWAAPRRDWSVRGAPRLPRGPKPW